MGDEPPKGLKSISRKSLKRNSNAHSSSGSSSSPHQNPSNASLGKATSNSQLGSQSGAQIVDSSNSRRKSNLSGSEETKVGANGVKPEVKGKKSLVRRNSILLDPSMPPSVVIKKEDSDLEYSVNLVTKPSRALSQGSTKVLALQIAQHKPPMSTKSFQSTLQEIDIRQVPTAKKQSKETTFTEHQFMHETYLRLTPEEGLHTSYKSIIHDKDKEKLVEEQNIGQNPRKISKAGNVAVKEETRNEPIVHENPKAKPKKRKSKRKTKSNSTKGEKSEGAEEDFTKSQTAELTEEEEYVSIASPSPTESAAFHKAHPGANVEYYNAVDGKYYNIYDPQHPQYNILNTKAAQDKTVDTSLSQEDRDPLESNNSKDNSADLNKRIELTPPQYDQELPSRPQVLSTGMSPTKDKRSNSENSEHSDISEDMAGQQDKDTEDTINPEDTAANSQNSQNLTGNNAERGGNGKGNSLDQHGEFENYDNSLFEARANINLKNDLTSPQYSEKTNLSNDEIPLKTIAMDISSDTESKGHDRAASSDEASDILVQNLQFTQQIGNDELEIIQEKTPIREDESYFEADGRNGVAGSEQNGETERNVGEIKGLMKDASVSTKKAKKKLRIIEGNDDTFRREDDATNDGSESLLETDSATIKNSGMKNNFLSTEGNGTVEDSDPEKLQRNNESDSVKNSMNSNIQGVINSKLNVFSAINAEQYNIAPNEMATNTGINTNLDVEGVQLANFVPSTKELSIHDANTAFTGIQVDMTQSDLLQTADIQNTKKYINKSTNLQSTTESLRMQNEFQPLESFYESELSSVKVLSGKTTVPINCTGGDERDNPTFFCEIPPISPTNRSCEASTIDLSFRVRVTNRCRCRLSRCSVNKTTKERTPNNAKELEAKDLLETVMEPSSYVLPDSSSEFPARETIQELNFPDKLNKLTKTENIDKTNKPLVDTDLLLKIILNPDLENQLEGPVRDAIEQYITPLTKFLVDRLPPDIKNYLVACHKKDDRFKSKKSIKASEARASLPEGENDFVVKAFEKSKPPSFDDTDYRNNSDENDGTTILSKLGKFFSHMNLPVVLTQQLLDLNYQAEEDNEKDNSAFTSATNNILDAINDGTEQALVNTGSSLTLNQTTVTNRVELRRRSTNPSNADEPYMPEATIQSQESKKHRPWYFAILDGADMLQNEYWPENID